MNRRNAISTMAILSAGVIIFPSCGQKNEATVKLKNFAISGDDENLLIQLGDAILPTKRFPADIGLQPHEFTLKMVDDCYAPDKQQQFTRGLKAFDGLAKKTAGKSFANLDTAQKHSLLKNFEKKSAIPEDIQFFYDITRRHTLQLFTSSSNYMTNVLKYKMVPGSNFKGCVPVARA